MEHRNQSLARLAFAAGLFLLPAVGASAQGAQSPYDTIYRVIGDTSLRAAPEDGSAVKAALPKGTEGVIMRWCRPEFSFRDWAYGTLRQRREMLKDRVCEVQAGNVIGFVDTRFLDPM